MKKENRNSDIKIKISFVSMTLYIKTGPAMNQINLYVISNNNSKWC